MKLAFIDEPSRTNTYNNAIRPKPTTTSTGRNAGRRRTPRLGNCLTTSFTSSSLFAGASVPGARPPHGPDGAQCYGEKRARSNGPGMDAKARGLGGSSVSKAHLLAACGAGLAAGRG